jgi:hypothetical protein
MTALLAMLLSLATAGEGLKALRAAARDLAEDRASFGFSMEEDGQISACVRRPDALGRTSLNRWGVVIAAVLVPPTDAFRPALRAAARGSGVFLDRSRRLQFR